MASAGGRSWSPPATWSSARRAARASRAAGDAAAAFVLGGNGTEPIARLIGRASLYGGGARRLAEPRHALRQAVGGALRRQHLHGRFWSRRSPAPWPMPEWAASDLSKVVLDGTNARVFRGFHAACRTRSGAAFGWHGGLGGPRRRRPRRPDPGERARRRLRRRQDRRRLRGPTVSMWRSSRSPMRSTTAGQSTAWLPGSSPSVYDLAYTTYLKWRDVLPFEPPRRPPIPIGRRRRPMQRAERWKFGFVGLALQPCCGNTNLPPQRVCVVCQASDDSTAEPYADSECRSQHLHPGPARLLAAAARDRRGGRLRQGRQDALPAHRRRSGQGGDRR